MDNLKIVVFACYLFSSAVFLAYLFSRQDRLQWPARWIFIAGFGIHSLVLIAQSLIMQRVPGYNFHQALSLAAWAIALVFIIAHYTHGLKIIGVVAAPLAAMAMAAAIFAPVGSQAITVNVNHIWVLIHVLTMFIGEAFLALACGTGILYLLQERAIKSKAPGFFFKRLPSLDHLDLLGYRCIVVGFTLLTIGLVSGAVYAKMVWGRFWTADPKEIWSVITWLIYAVLLHERILVGWRGRRAAMMAVAGFVVMLFTFFGVNFLLQGHHGQFTKI